MTWDEMTQVIYNPHTNRPLSKHSLHRHFKRELAEGAPKLRAMLGKRWLELIHSKDDHTAWRAVEFGLKYICGYRDDAAPQVNMAVEIGRAHV